MDKYTATEQAFKHGYEKGYEAGQSDVAAECQSCAKATKGVIESLQRKIATENNVGCKWIPVAKSLPAAWQPVLVYMKDQTMMISWINDVMIWKRGYQSLITHWMPLPEPPKEG